MGCHPGATVALFEEELVSDARNTEKGSNVERWSPGH